MPTLPPAYISLDSSNDGILPTVDVIPESQHTPGSPTPDPDLDDAILVAVLTGDIRGAVTQVYFLSYSTFPLVTHTTLSVTQPTSNVPILQDTPRTTDGLKPHISLSNLSLHSPSTIVGTPFDVSPRFEYPFPESSTEHDSPMISPFIPPSASVYVQHNTVALGIPPPHSLPPFFPPPHNHQYHHRNSLPTHLKLVHRDPPVPPGLVAKKRGSINVVPESLGSIQQRRSTAAMSGGDKEKKSVEVVKINADGAETQGSGDPSPSLYEEKEVPIDREPGRTPSTSECNAGPPYLCDGARTMTATMISTEAGTGTGTGTGTGNSLHVNSVYTNDVS
ncbi:hypothetical protein BDY19DRAFT_905290 [Irpex rosettiformis]|uniref:Uncharacterized protein n=1 Tax=Irpex rosettiformis TaxID=378272 RepID=A0ACB8U7P6_9APHY|nr:hypothetical protein BDY19DRAFT_905290 [Irpex rosettiformis]